VLAIFSAQEEAPWSGPNSFQATWGATPHTLWESDQILLLEPVVEAVVCAAVDIVNGTFVGLLDDPL
jgi:hypothetical protein